MPLALSTAVWVSLLLLFSDHDEDIPVYTTVLLQRQAEHYPGLGKPGHDQRLAIKAVVV
jgi:hypothetical protein